MTAQQSKSYRSAMNTPKFTAGTWRVWRDQDPKEPNRITTREGDQICILEPYNRDANAHLIAAGPELYAALELALIEMEFHDSRGVQLFNHTILAAHAALKKARGEA